MAEMEIKRNERVMAMDGTEWGMSRMSSWTGRRIG